MQTDLNGMTQTEDLLLRGGSLVCGDGRTYLQEASIRVRRGRIAEVRAGLADACEGERVLETHGLLMLPGFINGHAHGTVLGPSMPSGSLPLQATEVDWQRNRHLLSGTTSLLNVCGLALPDERDGALGAAALDIHLTSAHTPSSIAAADEIDGRGLQARHRRARVADLVDAGCRVLGEAGGGQTLGGGAQEYRYIPDAIEAMTGHRIAAGMARRLKEAILGRKLDGADSATDDEIMRLLDEAGLADALTPASIKALLRQTVLAPVRLARQGLHEIAEASAEFAVPAIFHTAAPTASTLIALKRRFPRCRMIAAHANHPSFLPDEAVETAQALRALGARIDVSTLDMIETRHRNTPETLDALVHAGLVDTISTDYAGGDWDTIPAALQRMTRLKQKSLPEAIAFATGNVAEAFPEIFADRGLLVAGRRADITVTEPHNLARVRHVLVCGQLRVLDGALMKDGSMGRSATR